MFQFFSSDQIELQKIGPKESILKEANKNGEKHVNGNSGFVPEKSILGNAYENGNTKATEVAMNETEM